LGLKLLLGQMLCENFKEKKIKNTTRSELPKALYYQKNMFGALGVDSIWICDEKVKDNLLEGQLEHFLEKNNL